MPDTIILKQEESIKKSIPKEKVFEMIDRQAGEEIIEEEDLFEETSDVIEEEIAQEFEEYEELLDSAKAQSEKGGVEDKAETESTQDTEIDMLLDEATAISNEIAEKVEDVKKEIKTDIEEAEQPKKTRGRKKKNE